MASTVAEVLLIEDDAEVSARVESELVARGLSVTAAPDGESGIAALRARSPDLVLLDLGLPDLDGYALLSAIRAARPLLPVIALTASSDARSTLDGFAAGADDCLAKPFSLAELAARVQARLRAEGGSGRLEIGSLSLDLATRKASLDGRTAALSARESALLAAFIRHTGEVLTRERLLRLVWELDFDPGSNVVDVYVGALRRKLGRTLIETVRGRGYRLRAIVLTAAGPTSGRQVTSTTGGSSTTTTGHGGRSL